VTSPGAAKAVPAALILHHAGRGKPEPPPP
jgi:hypothetical protein